MPTGTERVTVTLPRDLIREIERIEKNRSRFVLDAVRNELDRRRREELQRSLDNPHTESESFIEQGFDDWARSFPQDDVESLVDTSAGKAITWVPGQGWKESRK